MLLDACARHAAHAAFECLGVRMSYTEWERVSRAFAAFLIEEVKCQPGDRVAIMLPNLLAYPVAFLGALRAGLTVVNVNPLYTPRELERAACGCRRHRHRHHGEFRPQARIGGGRDAKSGTWWWRGSAISCRRSNATVFNFANTYIRRAVPAWRFEALHDAARRPAAAGRARAMPDAQPQAIVARSAAIYRRHDRRAERRDPDASQSGREHVAVPRRDRAVSCRKSRAACSRRCRSIISSR